MRTAAVTSLLLAEELPAVPAVVASLGEGEANRAAGAAVNHLVLHPVVGRRTTRLVADRPAEDSTPTVAHQDLTVVPEERTLNGEEVEKWRVGGRNGWFVRQRAGRGKTKGGKQEGNNQQTTSSLSKIFALTGFELWFVLNSM